MKLTGIVGVMLLAGTYYLLWVEPQAELENVIMRTRTAMFTGMLGSAMCVFYVLKKYI
jgi:lipid-A-disaccharide synthase-like uncharacterized protein